MYRLIVNTNTENPADSTKDKWEDVDLGDATIALTYQANDLAELKSREVNRSNRIKLPRTARNNLLFGLPSEPLSDTLAPYRYFSCRLYDNGVELFGAGAKLALFEAGSESYDVALYGGLFDFFSVIKDKSIRDLTLDKVDWTLETVAKGEAAENSPVVFPVADWDKKPNSLTFDEDENGKLRIKAPYILPAVRFKWICEAICREQGYSLSLPGEVSGDTRYYNAVVPVVTASLSSTERFNASYAYAATMPGVSQTLSYSGQRKLGFAMLIPGMSIPGTVGNGNFHHPGENNPDASFIFRPLMAGTYTFSYGINIVSLSGAHLYLRCNGSTKTFFAYSGKKHGTFTIENAALGEEYAILIDVTSGSEGLVVVSEALVQCTNAELSTTPFPQYGMSVAPKLPNISQLDFLKAFANLWCLMVAVDERQKTIRFYGFEEVYRNMRSGNYYDWSGKLDDTAHRCEFRWSSYAQQNRMAYAADKDENDISVEDTAYLTVNDHTLNREKELFTLPFYACQEVNRYGVSMAKLRGIEGGDVVDMEEANPKLLCVEEMNREVIFVDSSYPILEPKSIIHLAGFSPMSVGTFIHNYAVLQNGILRYCRLTKEKFYLTSMDVQIFDHSIPVFISKYSCFFYVNKISNYVPGQLTEVELVALKSVT